MDGGTVVGEVMGTGHDEQLYEEPDPREIPGSSVGNIFGFHGLPRDSETGFLYFRNRYYDPEFGRFITADPLGYVDGPSMYQFAGYSPTNFGDPLGLETEVYIAGVHVFTVPDWAETMAKNMVEEHLGKMAGMAAETVELLAASKQVSDAGFGDPFSGMAVLGAQQAWAGYKRGQELGERLQHAKEHGAPGDYEAEYEAVKAELYAMAAEGMMSLPIFQTVEGVYQTRAQTTPFERGYWKGRTAFRFLEDASLIAGIRSLSSPSPQTLAARSLADRAQFLKPRPGAAAAFEAEGRTFTTVSGSRGTLRQPLEPRVQKTMDSLPPNQRSTYHGSCAEPGVISDALYAGVDPRGGRLSVVKVRGEHRPGHGEVMVPCASCDFLLQTLGIRFNP